MKLATFIAPDGSLLIGALIDDDSAIAALQAGATAMEGARNPEFDDMLAFIDGGPAARYKAHVVLDFVTRQRPAGTVFPLDLVRLEAPVPVPRSIRACSAFEQHVITATRVARLGRLGAIDERIERWFGRKASLAYRANLAWYRAPHYYKANRLSVVGHEATVHMPAYTRQFDYALEWGVFIGKQGRDITAEQAHDHIAGYTVFNDFSARDEQARELEARLGPAKSKDFDTGNAMGPWLVTPDEVPDPYRLTLRARVNGQEWSRGSSADMHWTFEEIIAHISRSETLYPGEFIGSGTCSGPYGHGCGLELGKYLMGGDVVELEVERIGTLRNSVAPREGGGVSLGRARQS